MSKKSAIFAQALFCLRVPAQTSLGVITLFSLGSMGNDNFINSILIVSYLK